MVTIDIKTARECSLKATRVVCPRPLLAKTLHQGRRLSLTTRAQLLIPRRLTHHFIHNVSGPFLHAPSAPLIQALQFVLQSINSPIHSPIHFATHCSPVHS
eukprot:1161628-Pelagomonas_calceolata.AAC.19